QGADSRGPPSVSDFVLDASLALQWFLEDEENRKYSLAVLASLSEKRALVPLLWFYECQSGSRSPGASPLEAVAQKPRVEARCIEIAILLGAPGESATAPLFEM